MYVYLVCGNTMLKSRTVLFRTEKSPEHQLRGSRIKKGSSLRTNSNKTWRVDTHMVIPQTKYILIPLHAMPQLL